MPLDLGFLIVLAVVAAGAGRKALDALGMIPEDPALRCLALAAWLLPVMWFWGRRHEWGGLLATGPGKWLSRPWGRTLQ